MTSPPARKPSPAKQQPVTAEVADDRGSASAAPNRNVATTSADESSNPLQPNDRDEKVGMTGGAPSAHVQQGARDLARGLQDTTRAPEADAAYRKLKR